MDVRVTPNKKNKKLAPRIIEKKQSKLKVLKRRFTKTIRPRRYKGNIIDPFKCVIINITPSLISNNYYSKLHKI